MILIGVFLRDQELRRRSEVVKDILLFIEHAGAVPVFAELGSATQISHGKYPTVLKPKITVAHEIRSQADIESAIAGEKGRILPVEYQISLVEHEHGHMRAVFGIKPKLLDFVLFWINSWSIHFAPKRRGASGQVNLINRIRHGEGMEREEDLFAVPLAADSENTPDRGKPYVAERLAVRVQQGEL